MTARKPLVVVNGNLQELPTGDSLALKLSAFAATTSAELAGVISDETGTGGLVFGTSPTVSSPTISSGNLIFSGAVTQRIGLFNASPSFAFHAVGDGTAGTGVFAFDRYTNHPVIRLRRGNTSIASPSAALANDILGATSFEGYQTTTGAFSPDIASFRAVADENFTSTANGSRAEILTTPNGSTSLAVSMTIGSAGHITPGADNTQNNGAADKRWKELFCGNSTINTSDGREKTPVRALSAAELAVAKQLSSEIGIYQWIAAIEEKGDGARLHVGMTVQRAVEIFVANGLDPFHYSLVCYDEWAEKTTTEEAEAGDPGAVIDGTKQVQATETQTRHWQDIEIIDGVATLVAKSESFEAPVFDLLPVFDESGEPVMRGDEQVTHQAPVMIEVPRYVKITHTPAGNRYGFRGNELLLLIAAGFNARLAALESVP